MSSSTEPSLADLLVMVPDLLPNYVLPQWHSQQAGIKNLRLVSKDVGVVALRAATFCKLKIGKVPCLPAQQVAALFLTTQLKSMAIIFDVAEGGWNHSSTARMLHRSGGDMGCVLSAATGAFRNITDLELDVRRLHLDESRSSASTYTYRSTPASGTGVHYQAPRKAFVMLATALPSLQSLRLNTQYEDVDLAAFGAHCPDLKKLSLKSDALGLHGIDVGLPNLTCLDISSGSGTESVSKDVKLNFEKACLLLRGCSNLSDLTTHFNGYLPSNEDELSCPKKVWEQLPASLVKWSSNGRFANLHKATTFLSRLQALHLGQLPDDCSHLAQFLQHAPNLKRLSILTHEHMDHELKLLWRNPPTEAELARLKAHLLGGFQLSCERVNLTGSHQLVKGMLTWLSPLPETVSTHLLFDRMVDGEHLVCLGQLPRVCPGLLNLVLGHKCRIQDEPSLCESSLVPLRTCKNLMRLDLVVNVGFTHEGMVDLCMSMPKLEWLYYWPCKGIDSKRVMKELKFLGSKVLVTAFCLSAEPIPHFYDQLYHSPRHGL